MATPVNFLFTDQVGIVDGSFNGVTGLTELHFGVGEDFIIFGGNFLIPLTLAFSDAVSFSDSFSNQPLIKLEDSFSVNDSFGLFLSEGILLLLGDMLGWSDGFQEQCIISVVFNDQFTIGDTIQPGAGNNPLLSDTLNFSDSLQEFLNGLVFISGDSLNLLDSLVISEGFVGESVVLGDSLSISDLFQIHLPNVGVLISLSDTLTFNDSVNTSNVEMLNTYLRRYLNDVISN